MYVHVYVSVYLEREREESRYETVLSLVGLFQVMLKAGGRVPSPLGGSWEEVGVEQQRPQGQPGEPCRRADVLGKVKGTCKGSKAGRMVALGKTKGGRRGAEEMAPPHTQRVSRTFAKISCLVRLSLITLFKQPPSPGAPGWLS